jgi:hypothetical protein
MHTILFAIKNYDQSTDETARTQWWNTVRAAKDVAARNPEIRELALGCWLLPVSSGLPFLGHGIAELEKHSLSYTLMFIENPPDLHFQQPVT